MRGDLQLIVSDFPEWLGNRRTPLVANQSMMSIRLIALDKHPGARPAGVSETWRRLMVNCIRRVTGQESKAACGTKQLSDIVEVRIEGGIHAMRLLWSHHSKEYYWGLLIIDA